MHTLIYIEITFTNIGIFFPKLTYLFHNYPLENHWRKHIGIHDFQILFGRLRHLDMDHSDKDSVEIIW